MIELDKIYVQENFESALKIIHDIYNEEFSLFVENDRLFIFKEEEDNVIKSISLNLSPKFSCLHMIKIINKYLSEKYFNEGTLFIQDKLKKLLGV